MKGIFRSKNFYIVFSIDILIIIISFYMAYAIRFDFSIPNSYFIDMLNIIPVIIVLKVIFFIGFHMYQGMWRYTSIIDLFNIVKAVLVSSISIILFILIVHRFEGYPRSVFIIDGILCLILIGGLRAFIRLYFAKNSGFFPIFLRGKIKGKKLLILGAGSTAEKVLREIRNNPILNYNPVGLLDDNPAKRGKMIHGVEVLGTLYDIEKIQNLFDEILIAIPSATSDEMRKIVYLCESTGKRFRTVPAISELIHGNISVKTARDVTLQDLLGRKEIVLSKSKIKDFLHEKKVIITGAGGSIGSELIRQISRFHPKSLALVEMSELNLFRLEMECKQRFAYVEINSYLQDIRDKNGLRRIFNIFKPHVIFHAAAYKHVPILELNPWEAVQNNILGSKNIMELADEFIVEKFVLVSSDKAVRPTNVMGASKRISELIMSSLNANSKSQFMAVRFGNVIGSSGSVIPVFQDQIARGGPVTVTHPEVTRYFMSIPEAAQLILEAGAMGKGGEIFILDMGKPIKIIDMARDLIRLHGFEPDIDINIQYIGLRPGEKLYEELITSDEGVIKTEHTKILVLKGNILNLNSLYGKIDELFELIKTYDDNDIKKALKKIIPEYMPDFY